MTTKEHIQSLLNFIDESPSPWHAVDSVIKRLISFGFIQLEETAKWELKTGGRYYVIRDNSSIILFCLGEKPLLETGFRIIGAHTDSPGLRVKPNAVNSKEGLIRLNVEIYGSPILATFADRDLSLAGRVCYKKADGSITTKLIKIDYPILRLPNLAIHMNRAVNEEGLVFHKQNELPLILTTAFEQHLPDSYFVKLLENHTELNSETILSWDLVVYDTQKGVIWGEQDAFYSDSQLDNLASCHVALQAFLDEDVLNGGNSVICALFDHEEIGSESKQGANGCFLPDVLNRIVGDQHQDFQRIMAKSFLVSADMAHAYHPNFPSAYDSEHKVLMNKGPAIKVNTNQRYSSEGISEALFINWCQEADVPFQFYSHRCDLPCGSTIGPMTSAKLGLRSIDIGNPMWAMHSIRESAGTLDHNNLIKVIKKFFKSKISH